MQTIVPALGLTPNSTNEAIRKTAFEFIKEEGWVVLSTTDEHNRPTSRGLELQILDETGDLYLGTSKGKPLYSELARNPYLSATAVRLIEGLSVSVRIWAKTEEIFDEGLIARYWVQNPGTKAMYRKNIGNFTFFKLVSGDGEVFHVCDAATVARVRFTFGGGEPRPFCYAISDKCIGCGICTDNCMTGTIEQISDKYKINTFGCLECGNCYDCCPHGAIIKR